MLTTTRSRLPSAYAASIIAALGVLLAWAPSAGAQTNVITTVAGTTVGFSGDSGPSASAQLNTPTAVGAFAGGGFLIADQGNSSVRRVLADGTIITVAGTGSPGFSGDTGPAIDAQLNGVNGVAMTTDGGFLVADSNNNRVRRVSAGGTITTAVGTGATVFNGDGIAAAAANVAFPVGVAVTADGGYLIGANDNHRVRRVSPGGTITTAAGTGSIGSTGDGGPATMANLNGPAGVSVAADGAILIADADNRRIRRVGTDGTITTVAGDGMPGSGGDGGPATAAQLNNPVGVAAMPDGGFVIADTNNHKIRRVSPGGTISTLAGTGGAGSGGDGGPATDAQLNLPLGVAATAEGDVLVADTLNHRVRLIDSGAAPVVPPPVDPITPPIAEIAQVPGEPDRDADTVPDARDNCPDAPNPTQSDRDADRIGDACDSSDASVGPTLARTVVGRVVSGEVFVRLPSRRSRAGGRAAQAPAGFVPIRGAAILPVGTLADTRRGRLAITSVASVSRTGRRQTQRADFFDGIFQIRQRRARRPFTDIHVRSTSFPRVCGASPRGATAQSAQRRSRRVVSRLWGDGRGRFRAQGRHSSATVRGTFWLTEERCDGTLTRVRRGSVTVRDKVARRTVIVRAGRSYLARRASRARARRG